MTDHAYFISGPPSVSTPLLPTQSPRLRTTTKLAVLRTPTAALAWVVEAVRPLAPQRACSLVAPCLVLSLPRLPQARGLDRGCADN